MGVSVNLTKEQQQVIDVKNQDVLVAASAGSGKTFVVVERIVNRVINDNINIDEILVVTFTNAAASELKERIVNRFYDYLKSNDIDDRKRKHVQKQLSLINRAQISTIHSFCLSIIKNNFYLLNVDPNIKTLDENKAKILLLESINSVIEDEYEEKSEVFFKVLELYKSDENISSILEKLYNFSKGLVEPKKWLNDSLTKYDLGNVKDLSEVDFGKQILGVVSEKVILLSNELENICNKIRNDSDFESRLSILEDMHEKIANINTLKGYDEIYRYIKTLFPFKRLPSSKCANEELKNEVSNIKKKVASEIENISKIIYLDTNGIIQELKSMHDILKWYIDTVIKIDEVYSTKKNSLGQIDFNDYEHLALKVLENEEVSSKYKKKFKEIYIDEYQDTSYIQEALIAKISENNRIMVGDVKQSIYSFRNAEPKLFNEKYVNYEKYDESKIDTLESKILLSKNFRSRKEVLDSVNNIFQKVMSDKIGECNYTNEECLIYGEGYDTQKEINHDTEICVVETKEDDISLEEDKVIEEIEEITNTQKEAFEVAKKIEELINSEYEIYDLKKKEYRKVEYKDIVILMRSVTGKASVYEEVLKSKNIPVFCDTSDSFYNGEEVGIILSLLKVLDNVYDDISLVSIMYSIIGKFTPDELICIRSYDKKGYFYEAIKKAYSDEKNKDSEVYFKIQKLIKNIEKFNVYLNTYSIAETILKIYNDTGIYYSFYLEELGKQKCANLDSLVELARNFEREEKSSIYQFINYIESMKESKSKGSDTPKLLGEGENVVRILTIHKSKGLEYPIVFLVNSAKKYNMLDASSEMLFDKELGIGIDIYNTEVGISYSSIIKQAIKEKIKNRTLSEEERLLYVAMTRAKEKLYIFGTTNEYNKLVDSFILKSETVSPVLVKECNNYLKLVMLALSSYKDENSNIKINVITNKENIKNIDIGKNSNIDRSISLKEKFLTVCKDSNIKENQIDMTFDKGYNYIESLDVKKKYSATEIKQMDKYKEEELFDLIIKNEINLDFNDLKPLCVDNQEISALGYGTIIHKILERIDYFNIDINNINKYIDEITKGTNIHANVIKKKIAKYLDSKLIKEIANAKEVNKEQPFVIYDKLEGISECSFNESTYIQGVIDLFVITKDNKKIIIDFKTDKVESETQLIDRYKTQLQIYKIGVELSLGTNVDEVYIYSFSLNEFIKLNI